MTASKSKDEARPDKRNRTDHPASKELKTDLVFEEVKIEEFDAITFVAGNGAWHDFFPNQKVHDLVKSAMKANKVVGLFSG